jgi:hypothetical protein
VNAHVLYQSPRPSANGRYWRIWSHGHVQVLPASWKPGKPEPRESSWPTDTPDNRAKAYAHEDAG